MLPTELGGGGAQAALNDIVAGLVRPTWPNGGWSITVELHFYLVLPLILALRRKYPWSPALFLLAAIGLRAAFFQTTGSVQDLSYWTIAGRIDQFVLGIACYDLRSRFTGRHGLAALALGLFALFYYLFDKAGGFYDLGGDYPSRSPLWIVMPTLEGVFCAILIAWYDTSFRFEGPIARFVETIGFYSYGIYLLHIYFVFRLAQGIDKYLFSLQNFYVAWAVSVPLFCTMLIPAWLAYRYIEKPCQRFKPKYVVAPGPTGPAV